ncbi:MAG: glycosyltransferase, partial [Paludibacteraceae bacterium]|nr:glycosyltransferase [Paludibacteraceae bacterium]
MILRSDNYISNPVVACGIIVYNQKDYIAQCIEGMLMQECNFPFNIVIADDCSTDGTQDILREYQTKYPDKIKLVLNEKNGGIAANWVSCCRALEGGEFVSFCDGDDYWSNPHKLQLQVDYLRQHPECVAVSSDYDTMNADGSNYKSCVRKDNPPLTGHVQYDLWTSGKAQNAWCCFMFTRHAFDRIPLQGFIDHDFPFQDWPALVILAGYGEFHYLPISTCVVRAVLGSDSKAVDLQKLIRRQQRSFSMNNYLASLFPDVLPVDDKETFDRYIAGTLISTCILNNDYKSAK